jgi:hypothetical protein
MYDLKDEAQDNPTNLRLNLNETNILDWFRQKYREIQKKFDSNKSLQINKNKGIKM